MVLSVIYYCFEVNLFNAYCLISLTLPVDLCLYMAFLMAWRIVFSRASPGEL